MKVQRAARRCFLALLVVVGISFSAKAAEQATTSYQMGTACQHDSECFEGCRTGTDRVNCIHESEGVRAKAFGDPSTIQNACTINIPRPPDGLSCLCKPGGHVCGYAISGSGN